MIFIFFLLLLFYELIFGRVPSECFHVAVLAENQRASAQSLRGKEEWNHVFAYKLAHVKDVNPCLALVGKGFLIRISVTSERLCFRHTDEWRFI